MSRPNHLSEPEVGIVHLERVDLASRIDLKRPGLWPRVNRQRLVFGPRVIWSLADRYVSRGVMPRVQQLGPNVRRPDKSTRRSVTSLKVPNPSAAVLDDGHARSRGPNPVVIRREATGEQQGATCS